MSEWLGGKTWLSHRPRVDTSREAAFRALLKKHPRLKAQMDGINALNLETCRAPPRRGSGSPKVRDDFEEHILKLKSRRVEEAQGEEDSSESISGASTEAALCFWQCAAFTGGSEDGRLGCERPASDSGTCPSCRVEDGDGSESVGSSEAPDISSTSDRGQVDDRGTPQTEVASRGG